MQPIARDIQVNGVTLAYYEWSSDSDGGEPPLIFAHATGFHARVFDAVIAHFPDRHVYSLDLRGHGRTTGGPIEHWSQISSDVNAFLDHLSIRDAVGIGHSMGAHTLLQCAADRPNAFRQLVLFDPVILAPEYYVSGPALATADAPHPAIRRKRDFDSPEAMIERFKDRDPYNLFDRRVFEDYCRYGLTKLGNGEGYELACPPEVEASVYASSRSNSAIHQTAKRVRVPTTVVRAQQTGLMDFKGSPTWPEFAASMPNGTDMHRPDMTHFHPFEDPADAARIIAEAMAR